MAGTTRIATLFLDIGGVLLTNGWDHYARRRAVANFNLEWDEVEPRHQLNFATYEEGKLTLQDYLTRTIFYVERPFTHEQFWEFMTAQSQPDPEMLDLVVRLKARHGLRIVAVSNEARELNAYRIREFELDTYRHGRISSGVYLGFKREFPLVLEKAAEIRLPTFMHISDQDPVVSSEAAMKFFDAISSEKKGLKIVEGGKHELYNDTVRDEVIREVLNFVNQFKK